MRSGFAAYIVPRAILIAGLALGVSSSVSAREGAPPSSPDDPALQWGECPAFMPKGCQIAVLHGDPSQPNADVFFRLENKSTVPRHWHSSAERMVLLKGTLTVRYDGQAAVTLKPGSYAYGAARHPHEATCVNAPCVLFIAFEAPVDAHAGEPPGL